MNSSKLIIALVLLVCATGRSLASGLLAPPSGLLAPSSGMLGIYGIVEKVVFEPNEQVPDRVQLRAALR